MIHHPLVTNNGAYASEIQKSISEILRQITPFVCSEPLRGFVDYIAYINEEVLTVWIKRGLISKQHPLVNTCKYYDRYSTLCREKRTKCIAESCEHYQILVTKKKEMKKRLKKGIHLLEVKSNKDNVKRFGFQLPHYCLFGDYIWLVLEDKKTPVWLPQFVGVMRFENNTLTIKRDATKIERVPHLNEKIIPSTNPNIKQISNCKIFLKFLRAWFINSIFQFENNGNNVIETPYLDRLIRFQKKVNKARNLTYLNIKKLNEFIEEK